MFEVPGQRATFDPDGRWRDFVDAAPGLMWFSGSEGQGLYFNQSWLTFTGASREALLGDNWLSFVHADDRQPLSDSWSECFQRQKPFAVEFRLRRFDGVFRWFLDNGSPQIGPDGELLGFLRTCIDISDHKRDEDALRDGEQRLRLALEAGRMGNWEWHIPTNRVIWSEALEAIHGLAPGTFAGTFEAYQQDIHPDDRAMVQAAIAQTLETGEAHHIEYRIVLPDGRQRWVEGRGKLFRDASGSPVRMIGVCTDVTDRKRVEQALYESDERFSRFMQHLPGLAWIKDTEGRYVYVNDAAAAAFQKPRDELYGKADSEIFSPEVAAMFRENDQKALASEAGVQTIETLRHADGIVHHSIVSKFRMPGTAEHAALVGGVAVDITGYRQAIAEKERELRLIAETTPLILTRCSRDLRYRFVNRAAAALFGMTPEEIVGKRIADVLGATAFAKVQPHFDRVLRGESVEFEAEIVYPAAGQRWIRATYTPERDEHEIVVGWVASIVDITELKLAEGALRDAHRRKDEFLAMLAHELRNPLAPIRSGLDLLAMEGDRPREPVALMQEQVQHLVRLVDDLLDVSRVMRGKIELRLEHVDLLDLVLRSVTAMRPFIESRRQQLVFSLPQRSYWLRADPVRLVQVFQNLLQNAAKYTDIEGRIELHVTDERDYAVIGIRDTGIGIEPELAASIFDLFTQSSRSLDRAQGGLGIGLTLARRLVEMHGGTICVHSDGPGKGSEFTVRLPLADVVTPAVPMSSHSQLAPRRRVVVVDDNLPAAKMLKALLAKLGDHEVTLVHDGPAALEVIRSQRPDLVLLDIGLPQMDGYQIARGIRKDPELDEIYLVAVTGYGHDDDRRRSKEAGFDLHLTKPIGIADLENVLHQRMPR
jgi:PAS domain S-box-containing protein